MLKKLQLYTVCIIIVVIVLSQFTLLNNSVETDLEVNEKEQTYSQTFIDEIKGSKYAQPFNEIKDTARTVESTINEFQKDIESIKDFLDIEKSINEISKALR